MSGVRVLRRADHEPMAWRNGGGTTLEVARGDAPGSAASGGGASGSAAAAGFTWRVSFAHVEGDGPFSAFPGIDRVITLVSGGPMRLGVAAPDGEGPGSAEAVTARQVDLRLFEPFAFPGEAAVDCVVGQPCIDLNLMTARQVCTGSVTTARLGPGGLDLPPAPPGQTRLVAVLEGPVLASVGGSGINLGALDVLSGLGEPCRLTGGGVVAVLAVTAVPTARR